MRYFYYLFFFCFSISSFSQNDLTGEWFLHYIEVDGVQVYSTVPNSFNNIIFDVSNYYGTVCDNGYGGDYSLIDDSTLQITNFVAFAGFCNYLNETLLFLHPYFSVLSNSPPESNIFNYSITDIGNNETLQLTNSQNNLAVYGRSPLPENRLPGFWFLHSITKDDVEEINTFIPTFSIQFTTNAGSFMSLDYDGSAVCNNYFGEYHLEGIDNIRVIGFNSTLVICNPTDANTYESSYRSFFEDFDPDTDALLNYVTFGYADDETLVLTAENGDFLTYGRQTLSIEENTIANLNIRLNENPVKSELMLDISEELGDGIHYQIYSVDGKKIAEGQLMENHLIDVNNLKSGLYFLQVASENYSSQIIKFVKR